MASFECVGANWTFSNATFDNTTFNESLLPIARRSTPTQLLNMYRPATEIIDKYITPIYYIVGFPGNLLAFFVWIQKRMRPSSGCYLAALAMDDFIFLIMQLIFELQTLWGINVWHVPVWCELFPILFYSSQYLSPLLVLAFTVERFISICYPFQRETYCTTRRAVTVIISLIIICISVNLVQGYFWTYQNGLCDVRSAVYLGNLSLFYTVWSWVTELLVFGLVPLAILTLNVLVMLEMRRMMKRFGNFGIGNSKETTITLLAVSLYLIITTLPVTLCFSLVLHFPSGDDCLSEEEILVDPTWQSYFDYWNVRIIIQELGMSHYACNFFIYLATGSLFRNELWMLIMTKVFRRRLSRHDYIPAPSHQELTHLTKSNTGLSRKSIVSSHNLKNGDCKNGSNGTIL